MKKFSAVILTLVLTLTLFSCQKPLTEKKIADNYTTLNVDAKQMYFDVIDSLKSGEIKMSYSANKSVTSTTVKFNSLDNGEKVVLAEVKYPDSLTQNYFDGENFHIIVDGVGTQVEGEYIEPKELYRNLLGAPEEYFGENSTVSAYQKNDNGAYLITSQTPYGYEEEEYFIEEGTVLINFYLDENKIPQKLEIFYTFYLEDDKTETSVCTISYSKLGEEIKITAPHYETVSE